MNDEKKDNPKAQRRRPTRQRAEAFAAQMNELKEFVHAEFERGAKTAEVERKLDKKIDRVISEVRDYERLEHIIEAKAKNAISSVNARLGIFSFILAITGLLGWNLLVEQTTKKAISEIAGTAAHGIITAVVSNQVDVAQKEVGKKVAREIESRVPEMVSANVSDLRKLSKAAGENIKAVQSIVDTMTIVTAARANSRKHFNQLISLANGTNNTAESKIASDAIKTIRGQYEQRNFSFDFYRPTLTIDGRKKDIEDLVYIARADYDHNCNGAVADLIVLNNKEFVGTLVHVTRNTKRLDTLHLSMLGIERLTGKRFQTLDTDGVLDWWKEASKNKSYHSHYEWYCDMTEQIYCHSSREQIIAASTNMINEAYKRIKENPDYHIASKFIIETIIAFPDFKTKIADGRKSYFEEALKNLEGSTYKNNKWYIYKAYYLAIADNSALNGFINERLSTNPEFEEELKNSRLFTEHFFNDKQIKWPSKLPPEQRKPKTRPDVLRIPLNPPPTTVRRRGIESQNVTGLSSVKIKKGTRVLNEFPTNGTVCSAMQKLSDLKTGVCRGDSISWKLEDTSFRFNFNGKDWIDANTNKVEDVIIPAGAARITYERIKDEETSVTFTGSFDIPLNE